MGTKIWLPSITAPINGPWPEQNQFSPTFSFNIIPISTFRPSNWSAVSYSHLCNACYIPCHSSFNRLCNSWREVQITKLLVVQFCPSYRKFFPFSFRPPYSSWNTPFVCPCFGSRDQVSSLGNTGLYYRQNRTRRQNTWGYQLHNFILHFFVTGNTR
jgi:hypothetical protein